MTDTRGSHDPRLWVSSSIWAFPQILIIFGPNKLIFEFWLLFGIFLVSFGFFGIFGASFGYFLDLSTLEKTSKEIFSLSD